MSLSSCERVVEINDPVPQTNVFCNVEDQLEGVWSTDSVVVVTSIDSLDSNIINPNPGIVYRMEVECGAEKLFELSYTGFHNVTTLDVSSENFESVNDILFAYDPFDETNDTSNAGFRMPYQFENDTTLNCTIRQRLNADQRSVYYLYFKKV